MIRVQGFQFTSRKFPVVEGFLEVFLNGLKFLCFGNRGHAITGVQGGHFFVQADFFGF